MEKYIYDLSLFLLSGFIFIFLAFLFKFGKRILWLWKSTNRREKEEYTRFMAREEIDNYFRENKIKVSRVRK